MYLTSLPSGVTFCNAIGFSPASLCSTKLLSEIHLWSYTMLKSGFANGNLKYGKGFFYKKSSNNLHSFIDQFLSNDFVSYDQ